MSIVKNPKCNVDALMKTVKTHVPEAQLESNAGAELTFVLPRERSPNFEGLFTELETNKIDLGIDSFGASVTTMEEVFIK